MLNYAILYFYISKKKIFWTKQTFSVYRRQFIKIYKTAVTRYKINYYMKIIIVFAEYSSKFSKPKWCKISLRINKNDLFWVIIDWLYFCLAVFLNFYLKMHTMFHQRRLWKNLSNFASQVDVNRRTFEHRDKFRKSCQITYSTTNAIMILKTESVI